MISETTRKKLSESHKGKMPKFIPDNTGRIHSAETRKNMSLAHIGKKLSEEQKLKIGKANLGQHYQSEEWKKKISQERMGKGNPMYGIRGSAHPRWKGGLTSEREMARKGVEARLWRKSVFERDNFTCQKYKIKGGTLNAHHINNFADFTELRYAIDNGITLSEKAHKEFHLLFGKRNNTREQLQEFLNTI
jgi:hypothetical protein